MVQLTFRTESQAWRVSKTIQAVIPNLKIVQEGTSLDYQTHGLNGEINVTDSAKVIIWTTDESIIGWLNEYYKGE